MDVDPSVRYEAYYRDELIDAGRETSFVDDELFTSKEALEMVLDEEDEEWIVT